MDDWKAFGERASLRMNRKREMGYRGWRFVETDLDDFDVDLPEITWVRTAMPVDSRLSKDAFTKIALESDINAVQALCSTDREFARFCLGPPSVYTRIYEERYGPVSNFAGGNLELGDVNPLHRLQSAVMARALMKTSDAKGMIKLVPRPSAGFSDPLVLKFQLGPERPQTGLRSVFITVQLRTGLGTSFGIDLEESQKLLQKLVNYATKAGMAPVTTLGPYGFKPLVDEIKKGRTTMIASLELLELLFYHSLETHAIPWEPVGPLGFAEKALSELWTRDITPEELRPLAVDVPPVGGSMDQTKKLERSTVSLEDRSNQFLLRNPQLEGSPTREVAQAFIRSTGDNPTMTYFFQVSQAVDKVLGRGGAIRLFDKVPAERRVVHGYEWPLDSLGVRAWMEGPEPLPIEQRLPGAQGDWQNYLYQRTGGRQGVMYLGPGKFESQLTPQSYNFGGGLGLLVMGLFEELIFGGPRSETKPPGINLYESGTEQLVKAVQNLHAPFKQFQNPQFYQTAVERSVDNWLQAVRNRNGSAANTAWWWLSALLSHRVVDRNQYQPIPSPFARSGGVLQMRQGIDPYVYAMRKTDEAIDIGSALSDQAKQNIPYAAQFNRPIWLEEKIQ
jgi:hypothetical protein